MNFNQSNDVCMITTFARLPESELWIDCSSYWHRIPSAHTLSYCKKKIQHNVRLSGHKLRGGWDFDPVDSSW